MGAAPRECRANGKPPAMRAKRLPPAGYPTPWMSGRSPCPAPRARPPAARSPKPRPGSTRRRPSPRRSSPRWRRERPLRGGGIARFRKRHRRVDRVRLPSPVHAPMTDERPFDSSCAHQGLPCGRHPSSTLLSAAWIVHASPPGLRPRWPASIPEPAGRLPDPAPAIDRPIAATSPSGASGSRSRAATSTRRPCRSTAGRPRARRRMTSASRWMARTSGSASSGTGSEGRATDQGRASVAAQRQSPEAPAIVIQSDADAAARRGERLRVCRTACRTGRPEPPRPTRGRGKATGSEPPARGRERRPHPRTTGARTGARRS